MSAPNVAFCRPLKPGMRGADVIAHKRAISRNMPKVYPWYAFTNFYGPEFQKAVEAFQRKKGIPHGGAIGSTTHEALERSHNQAGDAWAFDASAIKLAHDFCQEFSKTPEERVREGIVDAAYFWYAHRNSIAYSQARPFQLGKPGWVPSREDCSGFATACHFAGGAPDPNGRNFDHLGYTGTLMSTGTRVGGIHQLKPGDLIFYGYTTRGSGAFPVGSPTHVAVYVGSVSGTPSVISNGSYPMGLYDWNYRSVNHLRHYKVA